MNFQQSSVDILSLEKLESMCTTDFDVKTRNMYKAVSLDDKRTLKIMKSSVTREDGHIRSDMIRMRTSQIVRPITKMCLLENSN